MTRIRPYWLRIRRFLLRYSSLALFAAAVVLLALSYIRPDYEARLRRQVARVLVNLITNAIQAIDSSGTQEGRIRIRLLPSGPEKEGFWRIDVEDNGPGVSEEDMAKLFTPNFTTKKTGTGLGLAICRSIIEQSQGTIGYSRSDLGGAKFTVELPAVSPSFPA